jgi:hypothetical protein
MVSCIQFDKSNKLTTIDISANPCGVRQHSKAFLKALGNFRREGAKNETWLKVDPEQDQEFYSAPRRGSKRTQRAAY